MKPFIELDTKRKADLAKLSGSAREDYLIDIINDLTQERNKLQSQISQFVWKDGESYNY